LATLNSINSNVWGLSLAGYGVIVEGIAAIRQRIDIAIRTTKGTDPLRPEFGSLIFQYVDVPVNIAVPNIKAEIIKALQLWVPEIKVIAIKHTFDAPHNPVFEVTYRLTDDDLIDKLLFDLRQGTTTVTDALNEIILQAFFPPNPNNYRYTLKLLKNGSQVFPAPNPSGFASIQELFDWASKNLFYVGKWFLLPDRIACYMNSDSVTSASLAIEVLPITKLSASFPQLSANQFFNVQFKINGVDKQPAMPQTFTNPGEVLAFAQSNWQGLEWLIEFLQTDDQGVFSDEFSDEMDVAATGYNLIGISHDQNFVGDLQITIV
jgi:phage baseplate assembly protein W